MFALIRIYWALITELRGRQQTLLVTISCDENYGKPPHLLQLYTVGPDHRLTRDHQEAWGAGGQWSAGREPILTRLVVYCHFVSCIDQWLWFMIMWHHTVKHSMLHTYLEFVDLLRRLLTKINSCHACLVSTLHWAPAPSGAGHTLCGQTFHSSSSISNTTGIWREKIHGFILISYHRAVKICLATRK